MARLAKDDEVNEDGTAEDDGMVEDEEEDGDEAFHALGSGDEAAGDENVSPPVFKVGENVLATFGKRTFLAQLFKIVGDRYHVYYVGNGQVDVLNINQLAKETWPTKTRAQYLNAEFYCDGLPADPDNGLAPIKPGRWKVRRIVNNEYVCVRLSGGGPGCANCENFDIAYVIGEVRAEEEYVRERGPFCKGRR